MCGAQSCHERSYHAQCKGHQKCKMHAIEESSERSRKLAHASTIDKHLKHRRHWHRTEGKWEDDSNAQHLTGVIQHKENSRRCSPRLWHYRTHNGIGVRRDDET